jgi:hypothetical protein
MVAATATRVPSRTPDHVNQRIRRQTDRNIAFYAQHPEFVDERLSELDREWDIERVLETQMASAGALGLILGATVSPRFRLLTAITLGFFLQHAVQGWCPPLALWRRVGIRTTREIDTERAALLSLKDGHRRMHAGEEPRPQGRADGPRARKPKAQNPRSGAQGDDDGRGGRRAHESA